MLDLLLPGRSGKEVLTALRLAGLKTPVLFLTAKEDMNSVVRLLDNGADDYLAKPFFHYGWLSNSIVVSLHTESKKR